MSEPDTRTPRERYRAQVQEEIKRHAWGQIATAGASALSLNAIAKQMGMSGPALYRYFANRDELITELVKDAYRGLADTFAARVEAGADLDDLADALRRWALDNPQRYFLLYGTPVPGYRAPGDTTRIADEIMAHLLDVCAAGQPTTTPHPLDSHVAEHRDGTDERPAPSRTTGSRALAFWTRLHGVLSLELAGHFTGMGLDPAELYADEVRALGDQWG
ncbi:TetR/AcrR family transcriptional regulator [Streptomyces sp. NBC_01216]|uniref:TetR/AcrR family transcriptional regulator n=1 Tax=unclassified Streptomyces TaxID=2593676 RepID=UPI002E0EFC4E|nr:TetR/AcrR family transcriptional regulator [Streptomyces sp. NBC_01216]